ncbi:hypothetical protein Pelo_17541 [Pelomyxa schiedti]|nr:hypothetical protein Pelo_17541 [Pelomyxa schiedti]
MVLNIGFGFPDSTPSFATTLLSSATGCSAAFQKPRNYVPKPGRSSDDSFALKCLKVVVFHQPACMHANGSYSDCAGLEEKLLQMSRSAEELLVLTVSGYSCTSLCFLVRKPCGINSWLDVINP